VEPAYVLRLLAGLVTDRITCARLSGSAADHATCPPAADVLRLDYAVLPLINRRKAAEPTRRKDRADFMLRNKQIHSVMNHVRALEGLGGPSLCQECGARTAAQRTVWCASAGLAACADTRGRQQRILDELKAARLPLRGLRPLVTARGEDSELGWLATYALPLCEYLGQAISQPTDSLDVYRRVSRILRAASNRRITPAMVKDRCLRARKLK
jgi:hypothetical protein